MSLCLPIAEILMLAGGFYALIAGKFRLTRNLTLVGWRARIAGLFLLAPLPLVLVAGLFTGLLIGAGVLPLSVVREYAAVVEILLVVAALVGVVIYALLVKPKGEVPLE